MDLFSELRAKRPAIYLADERQQWIEALAEVVQAMPKPERRWACCVLIANDLAQAMPGLALSMLFQSTAAALLKEEDRMPQ